MAAEIRSESGFARAVAGIRQEHWLSLTLLALHGALLLELGDPLAKALLLSHFGFFLLWQPLWRGEQKLIPGQVVLIIGAAVLLIAVGSWWLMALWLAVLFSLIGGNVPGIKNIRQRIVSLLAAVYLLAILLTWVVPHLFPEQSFPTILIMVARYGLVVPALPFSSFAPNDRRSPRPTLWTCSTACCCSSWLWCWCSAPSSSRRSATETM